MVIDVLLFVANIGMTVWKSARRTTTSRVLLFGLASAALQYLPGMLPTNNQTIDRTGVGGWFTSGSSRRRGADRLAVEEAVYR